MGNARQGHIYPRPSSIRDHVNWAPLVCVAAGLLALAVLLVVPQGPGVPDPSFASAAVLP
jgi:hypothetical protein